MLKNLSDFVRTVSSSLNRALPALVLPLFLLFPSFVFAYSSMCYSPVQMAALLSKPKNKNSTKGLEKSIRNIKHSLKDMERALDEAEGQLADSLYKGKFDGMRRGQVASQIRDYMESGRDGWGCDSSSFLKEKGLLPPFLFELLGEALLPSARADTNSDAESVSGEGTENKLRLGPTDSAEGVSSNGRECRDSGGSWQDGQCSCEESKGLKLSSNKCVCIDLSMIKVITFNNRVERCKCSNPRDILVSDKCEECPSNEIARNNKCTACSRSQIVIGNECVTLNNDTRNMFQRNCLRGGGKWTDNRCKCDNLVVTMGDGETCRQKKCEVSGGEWGNNNCKCKDPRQILFLGKCMECPSNKIVKNNKCINCKNGFIVVGNECKEAPSGKWAGLAEGRCQKGGGKWQSNQCKCGELVVTMGDGENCQQKCNQAGKVWKNGQCQNCGNDFVLSDNQCKNPCFVDGNSSQCMQRMKNHCEKQGRKWSTQNNKCCGEAEILIDGNCSAQQSPATFSSDSNAEPCKSDYGSDVCKEQTCRQADKAWNSTTNTCCAENQKVKNGACVDPDKEKKKKPCPKWKKHKAFKKNGRVSSSFCKDYAKQNRECRNALEDMRELIRDIRELKNERQSLRKELRSRSRASLRGDTKKTEAGGLCIDCLKRVMIASKPSTGQTVGNVLGMITGAGLTVAGYNLGKNAQTDLNMLRVQQGYEAQNDYYSLMGASAGFPYMAQGLHGLTRTNTPVGGWSCTPTISPYGRPYNYQYGQGYNMGYW